MVGSLGYGLLKKPLSQRLGVYYVVKMMDVGYLVPRSIRKCMRKVKYAQVSPWDQMGLRSVKMDSLLGTLGQLCKMSRGHNPGAIHHLLDLFGTMHAT